MASTQFLSAESLQRLERVDARHLPRIAFFLGLYLGAATLAVEVPASRVLTYLLAAASLHGLSLFTHEAVHGSLSRHRWLNHLGGALGALPVLQNYAAYKVLHLLHHADLGGERDPDHYANYTRRRWLERLMNVGRLLLGYPAYVVMIPILSLRKGAAAERRWIALELLLLAAAIGLAWAVLPGAWLLHGWAIPMLIINTLVNVRGMSQHTYLPQSRDPVHGSRSILSNPVTRFFMCNENYHLEHHLYPRVPWYNLASLHRELRPALVEQRAPFIPSYTSFVVGVVTGRHV